MGPIREKEIERGGVFVDPDSLVAIDVVRGIADSNQSQEDITKWAYKKYKDPNRPHFTHDCSGKSFVSSIDVFFKNDHTFKGDPQSFIVFVYWTVDV